MRRDSDRRNAFVRWTKVPGIVGYNVLWGIRPNKLYQTYYVAIEAFDENGVSRPSAAVPLR